MDDNALVEREALRILEAINVSWDECLGTSDGLDGSAESSEDPDTELES
jgi:hypothetical protein